MNRHFIRHYIEMVVAMLAGMVVLGLPAVGVLSAAGVTYGELQSDAPAVLLLGMGVTMTVPMVAWMRHRGHRWQPTTEMAASMVVPTLGAVALLAGGVVTDVDTLLAVEHVVMLPSMLVAMLLRRDEYTAHHPAATA